MIELAARRFAPVLGISMEGCVPQVLDFARLVSAGDPLAVEILGGDPDLIRKSDPHLDLLLRIVE